ncbi:YibE/F family protein [Nocardioides sp. AX2bis]|uniref:YibE/F family protein n=1 Tax=Nocardioides sp. AX2bis TaxID=2653157 RepID=UPI0012F00C3E|nr:YibE/F family protein [Nocardioides sp. AX2bis]VXB88567.1 YibE/F family protein [Nocardioides sp. AX2bis]
MGAHHPRHAVPETRRMRRLALSVIVPIAALTLAAMVWLWPGDGVAAPQQQGGAEELTGEVVAIQAEECAEELPDDVNGCGSATVQVTGGADRGEDLEVPLPNGTGAPEVAEGDDVVLIRTGPDGDTYSIVDQQRGTGLWVLAAAFALALVAFGRWRGLAALAGLGVTFALLLLFVVPAILAGEPPLLVGSCAIMLTVLYLTHGFGLSTTVAVLGTLVSLTLTGLLSSLAVGALHLTGVTDDLSASVGTSQGINTQGLLLAGIVIGSLGVLDDVTVTQSATVTELARANPSYGLGQLYRAGSRVGRSHIASVVNTIVLAYAGSALPLLILIVANDDSLGGVVTDQVIAQEIVRSVVATLGLVAAVPLTTGLAALTFRKRV